MSVVRQTLEEGELSIPMQIRKTILDRYFGGEKYRNDYCTSMSNWEIVDAFLTGLAVGCSPTGDFDGSASIHPRR